MKRAPGIQLFLCLAFALASALAAPAGAEIVLLQPGPEGEDVPPYSFLPTQPRPNATNQWAFRATDEFGFDHSMETFLRFALPADLLGPGEAVGQAVFWIYYVPIPVPPLFEGSAGPGELWCHEVQGPWSEATLTWVNKPDYGPAFDGAASVEGYGLIWCDVTQLVAAWASGARPNHGIALTNSTSRLISFYSFEAPAEIHPNDRPSLAIEIVPVEEADADSDGVADADDVCTVDANPDQRDSDHDGYGNPCDADLDNDGAVGLADVGAFRAAFQSLVGQPAYDPEADFDGDGGVGLTDFGVLRTQFGGGPGPSGLACAGAVPCP